MADRELERSRCSQGCPFRSSRHVNCSCRGGAELVRSVFNVDGEWIDFDKKFARNDRAEKLR